MSPSPDPLPEGERPAPARRERIARAIQATAVDMPGLDMLEAEALRLADAAIAADVGGEADDAPNVPLHLWTSCVPGVLRCRNCGVKPEDAPSVCPGPFDLPPPMSREASRA